MPGKTLVIVDMQPVFKASKDPDTVIAVAAEIIQAKQNNHAIVVVEYGGSGKTHSGLSDLLKNYKHKSIISKHDDDGSKEVIRALNRRNFPMQTLRVCGVNTDCCVYETVIGLIQKLKKSQVEVVKKACNTENDNFSWRNYFRHPNLRLV